MAITLNTSTSKCAPGRGLSVGKHGSPSTETCFNLDELKQIAQTWNQSLSSTSTIPPGARESHQPGGCTNGPCAHAAAHYTHHTPIEVSSHTSATAIWDEIRKRMASTTPCQGDERCWLKQMPSVANIEKRAFRPAMPRTWIRKPNEWLSTTDIERVLKQYESHDPHFLFIGAVPIDFASPLDDGSMGKCVTQALCNVNVRSWVRERGHRRVGVVFNLDAHDEPGSHWVSAFFDLHGNAMMYYDSFGGRVPLQVHELFSSIGDQLEQLHGEAPTFRYNPTRHQFRNTECGVYSILFLASMVEAAKRRQELVDSYDEFVRLALNDRQVERYRHHFFDRLRTMTPGNAWCIVRGGGGGGGGGNRLDHHSQKKQLRRTHRSSRRSTKRCRRRNRTRTRSHKTHKTLGGHGTSYYALRNHKR